MSRGHDGIRAKHQSACAARFRLALALTALPGALLCCGPGDVGDQPQEQALPGDTVVLDTGSVRGSVDAERRPMRISLEGDSVDVSREPRRQAVATSADTTGVATGPGGRELDPAQLPPGAYEACKDSAAVRLPDPHRAVWGKLPDEVERGPTGEYTLVGQVRPDSLSPGLSFLCVLVATERVWRVVQLEMR